jgi:tetratricopeptide (TPR) repeat protein
MNAGKSRIFISYSHAGNGPKWKAAMLDALRVFEAHHLLDVWQDGKIRVSGFWEDDINQAMAAARLAVVLLTPQALESQFIREKEFPCLRERQHRDKLPVFPVICEPCDWKAHDWLRATQSPNESNPLSALPQALQDRAFRKLATDIAEEFSRVALLELSTTDKSIPPERIYLDKFPLTRGSGLRDEKLIGREQELALLDLAFAQPRTAIVSLVAWGGVGKTMLVQHWLRRLERERWFGARNVYAWSFYSQGIKEDRQASEDTFLAHALEWFGVKCEPTLSPWDKGRLLADAIARERTLLILDGIEPLQYPPGPMGGQLRAPGVQSLLKQLARKSNKDENLGLCLVTTREPLTDLADFQRREGSAWGSLLRVDLGNLTQEAGAALLHHAGATRSGAAEIKPDDKELLAASREVDGHALTLNLLGRFLARAHGGDIRRRDLVKFEEADRKEQGGTTFKVLATFENWFAKSGEFGARQLAVLRMLGLFDRPADTGCIGALRKSPVIAGLTDPLFVTKLDADTGREISEPLIEEDWNTATSFLSDFGLVVIQADAKNHEHLLDCHPLVRQHFAEQIHSKITGGWRAAHRRIYDHLTDFEPRQPDNLEGLTPLYQAVTHGCQADLAQSTLEETFFYRIRRENKQFSNRKLGAISNDLSAVASFFVEPWLRLKPGLSDDGQAYLIGEAGYCLRALGRFLEALPPMKLTLEMAIVQSDWWNASQRAINLSELEIAQGDLKLAISNAEKSVEFADRSGDFFKQLSSRETLAETLFQSGFRDVAITRVQEAEAIQVKDQPQFRFLYSTGGFRYCDILLSGAERAAWQRALGLSSTELATDSSSGALINMCDEVKNRTNQTLMWNTGFGLLDEACDHLTLGRITIYSSLLNRESHQRTTDESDSAKEQLRSASNGFRKAGTQHLIPLSLVSLSWLRFLEGDTAGARADLDEAWDIAERGPMRLHMADIHLYRARLFFREKTYPWKSPQADLAAAEKLINDCGYHRRDEELADAKRAILQ